MPKIAGRNYYRLKRNRGKVGKVVSLQEGHATLNTERKCPKCGKPTVLCDSGLETCSSDKCDYVSMN